MNDSKQKMELAGTVSLCKSDREFLGEDRIRLLEMIEEQGSITKAAKAVGISYKTAWDTMDAINNLSDKPLFVRMAGGKSGGGTRLTDEGREVIRKYRVVLEEHEKFLANISKRIGSANELYKFIKRISMKVSARNIFAGTVSGLTKGAINAEVTLLLKGGDKLVSVITNESIENLGLQVGSEAYAIIKASSLLIGKDLEGTRLSTSNILTGKIIKLIEGAVNTEVMLELSGGNTLSAIITNCSAESLALRERDRVCAICKASDIILGVS
jgi:molybdate transport system regulatory protein